MRNNLFSNFNIIHTNKAIRGAIGFKTATSVYSHNNYGVETAQLYSSSSSKEMKERTRGGKRKKERN